MRAQEPTRAGRPGASTGPSPPGKGEGLAPAPAEPRPRGHQRPGRRRQSGPPPGGIQRVGPQEVVPLIGVARAIRALLQRRVQGILIMNGGHAGDPINAGPSPGGPGHQPAAHRTPGTMLRQKRMLLLEGTGGHGRTTVTGPAIRRALALRAIRPGRSPTLGALIRPGDRRVGRCVLPDRGLVALLLLLLLPACQAGRRVHMRHPLDQLIPAIDELHVHDAGILQLPGPVELFHTPPVVAHQEETNGQPVRDNDNGPRPGGPPPAHQPIQGLQEERHPVEDIGPGLAAVREPEEEPPQAAATLPQGPLGLLRPGLQIAAILLPEPGVLDDPRREVHPLGRDLLLESLQGLLAALIGGGVEKEQLIVPGPEAQMPAIGRPGRVLLLALIHPVVHAHKPREPGPGRAGLLPAALGQADLAVRRAGIHRRVDIGLGFPMADQQNPPGGRSQETPVVRLLDPPEQQRPDGIAQPGQQGRQQVPQPEGPLPQQQHRGQQQAPQPGHRRPGGPGWRGARRPGSPVEPRPRARGSIRRARRRQARLQPGPQAKEVAQSGGRLGGGREGALRPRGRLGKEILQRGLRPEAGRPGGGALRGRAPGRHHRQGAGRQDLRRRGRRRGGGGRREGPGQVA
ncbi:hypothetical protein H696_05658 [Fonticula alba]|uniref:Uncharacterized protein n=1 Tax=Fonticula alba TaxID=691883 RepID=A0A058Z347_FONAL|nr:hypothetical protein H696_05658 [Fonticula alba]KCV67932.1 hypothetical protein H696_05658 [Fonticula alba]|eukprot:XP_009497752.1 hypothetical protein H696_05658 [Fonticula alba]